jgi:hypothetical protein
MDQTRLDQPASLASIWTARCAREPRTGTLCTNGTVCLLHHPRSSTYLSCILFSLVSELCRCRIFGQTLPGHGILSHLARPVVCNAFKCFQTNTRCFSTVTSAFTNRSARVTAVHYPSHHAATVPSRFSTYTNRLAFNFRPFYVHYSASSCYIVCAAAIQGLHACGAHTTLAQSLRAGGAAAPMCCCTVHTDQSKETSHFETTINLWLSMHAAQHFAACSSRCHVLELDAIVSKQDSNQGTMSARSIPRSIPDIMCLHSQKSQTTCAGAGSVTQPSHTTSPTNAARLVFLSDLSCDARICQDSLSTSLFTDLLLKRHPRQSSSTVLPTWSSLHTPTDAPCSSFS